MDEPHFGGHRAHIRSLQLQIVQHGATRKLHFHGSKMLSTSQGIVGGWRNRYLAGTVLFLQSMGRACNYYWGALKMCWGFIMWQITLCDGGDIQAHHFRQTAVVRGLYQSWFKRTGAVKIPKHFRQKCLTGEVQYTDDSQMSQPEPQGDVCSHFNLSQWVFP